MFDFKLNIGEEIEIISNDSILKHSDEGICVTVVITNQRLLILDFPKDLESFRVGRDIIKPSFKEVLFEVSLEDIVDIEPGEEFDKYMFKNEQSFYLADLQIRNYIETLKKC